MYLKLLCLFFHELPLSLAEGASISVKLLQRVGSYIFTKALSVVAMKPFTRAVHNNYSLAGHHTHMRLTQLSMSDILIWRAVLVMSSSDRRWFRISWYIPPYMARPRSSDRAEWALRMAAQATFIGHSDAMTDDTRHGIGAVFASRDSPTSPFAWFMDESPAL
jgi:alkylhydroperoxidase family enzyme